MNLCMCVCTEDCRKETALQLMQNNFTNPCFLTKEEIAWRSCGLNLFVLDLIILWFIKELKGWYEHQMELNRNLFKMLDKP